MALGAHDASWITPTIGRTGTTKSGGKWISPSRTGATQRQLPQLGAAIAVKAVGTHFHIDNLNRHPIIRLDPFNQKRPAGTGINGGGFALR